MAAEVGATLVGRFPDKIVTDAWDAVEPYRKL
jgi:hypothetical protein